MFDLARGDGEAARVLSGNATVPDEIIGFHVQQAIEKALKAWLAALGMEYPYSHNLILLMNLLEENGQDVERFRPLAPYNAFAVQFRYPGAEEIPVELDRRGAPADAASVLEHGEKMLEA
jgi:HEPN domain-containing protein